MNNKIQAYISELVGSHDCVIVPGLGAFIAQPTSADIHPITHKFAPPGRTIGFNSQIKINDGLLASFICTVENVSFQAANTLIEEFVAHFNNTIHLFKNFEVKDVGRFFYNLEGKLEFEPEYYRDFSSDSFGLTEFVFKPIERNTFDMNQPSQHRNAKTTASKSAKKEETTEERKGTTPFAKILLVVLPFLVLIGAAGYVVYNKQQDASLGSMNPFAAKSELAADTASVAVDSTATLDSTSTETIYEEQAVVEDNSAAQSILDKNIENSSAVLATEVQTGNYYIVVGSFKKEKNADRLFNKLTKKNESVVKIPVDAGGYYKIAFGGFNSKETALAQLETLGAKYGDLWIKKY